MNYCYKCGEKCRLAGMPVSTSDCQKWKKPKTNGDKIRNMTDEEILHLLIATCQRPCIAKNGDCDGEGCRQAWLDWLKEEHADGKS